MRQRDRFAHAVWLREVELESPEALTHAVGAQPATVAMLAHILTVDHGYYIETWSEGANHRVRVRPLTHKAWMRIPGVSASYRGPNMRSVLATALVQLSAVQREGSRWEVGPREAIQWVP